MPKIRLNVVYGISPVFTPNGIHLQNQAYGGLLDSPEHLEQVINEFAKPPAERKVIQITATKDELSRLDGVLSAKSIIDLREAKFLQVFEETDLDISATDNIRKIRS